MTNALKHRFTMLALATLGGILLGIGSRFPSLWMLSLTSFIPIMMVLARVTRMRTAFIYMFATGLSAYGFSFHALFWDSLPLTWLGVEGPTGVALIALIWAITTLIFGSIFAGALSLAYRIGIRGWSSLLLIPSVYVVADWIATWGFGIVNYGPFALVGPDFTMGAPAYQLAANGVLLQSASLGGIYALAFMQALIGVALFRVWDADTKRVRVILLIVILGVFLLGGIGTWWLDAGRVPDTGRALNVALITRYEPAVLYPSTADLEQSFRTLSGYIASVPTSTNVILLPEDTRFLEEWHREDVLHMAPTLPSQLAVIDSASEREGSGTLYSRVEYHTSSGSLYTYKKYLMPFGEYLPYLYQNLARVTGQGAVVDSLERVRGFHIKDDVHPVFIATIPIAALLCSEAMSPNLYADEARSGAEIFLNLASHSWFHGSHTLYTLAFWTGRVRAVESSRWYARAADGTPSFILDPYGRVRSESVWNVSGVLEGTIYARTSRTLYMVMDTAPATLSHCILRICCPCAE
jgi:apolipoprotein N-acyltransferase